MVEQVIREGGSGVAFFMKIRSYNVRGIGDRKKEVQQLVRHDRITIVDQLVVGQT